jgi:uncharacterized protein Yka (UPF0111/DUF47 family)
MNAEDETNEARLLRDLLSEAHAHIRELERRVDSLANALLKQMLNDRRRPVASLGHVERERRGVRHSGPTLLQ